MHLYSARLQSHKQDKCSNGDIHTPLLGLYRCFESKTGSTLPQVFSCMKMQTNLVHLPLHFISFQEVDESHSYRDSSQNANDKLRCVFSSQGLPIKVVFCRQREFHTVGNCSSLVSTHSYTTDGQLTHWEVVNGFEEPKNCISSWRTTYIVICERSCICRHDTATIFLFSLLCLSCSALQTFPTDSLTPLYFCF